MGTSGLGRGAALTGVFVACWAAPVAGALVDRDGSGHSITLAEPVAMRGTTHVLGLIGTDLSNTISISYDEVTDEYAFASEFTFAPPLPEGCASEDPPEEMHSIHCVRGVFDELDVDFLGGPDVVEMEPGMKFEAHVRAGEGADEVTTASSNDVVQGGPGNDVIATERGRDVIRGGAGRDKIDDGPGRDSVRP